MKYKVSTCINYFLFENQSTICLYIYLYIIRLKFSQPLYIFFYYAFSALMCYICVTDELVKLKANCLSDGDLSILLCQFFECRYLVKLVWRIMDFPQHVFGVYLLHLKTLSTCSNEWQDNYLLITLNSNFISIFISSTLVISQT